MKTSTGVHYEGGSVVSRKKAGGVLLWTHGHRRGGVVGLAVDTGEDGCEHHEVNFEEDLAVRGRRAEHDDPVSLRAELICLLGFCFGACCG